MPMLATLLLAYLWMPAPVQAESTVQLYGPGYSFEVVEPSGWVLDTGSAPQIAHFILHPKGVSWREAEAVIYSRFVRRNQDESLESFLEQNSREFWENCPFAEEGEEVPFRPVESFEIELFHCPGGSRDWVAARSVPGYFVVFVLSGEKEFSEGSLGAFRRVLESFRWSPLPQMNLRGSGDSEGEKQGGE